MLKSLHELSLQLQWPPNSLPLLRLYWIAQCTECTVFLSFPCSAQVTFLHSYILVILVLLVCFNMLGAPGLLSQLRVQLLIPAQVTMSRLWDWAPCRGLPLPLPLTCLALSMFPHSTKKKKKNKHYAEQKGTDTINMNIYVKLKNSKSKLS